MKVESTDDFIGIYNNVLDNDSCQLIIEHFHRVQEAKLTYNRQEVNSQIDKTFKDNQSYYLTGRQDFIGDETTITKTDSWIFDKFKQSLEICYKHYSDTYGILSTVAPHAVSGSVKIQQTKPSQGYHVWHCEHGCSKYGDRLILGLLYLNDVEDGGETEFLYQSKRVKPEVGKLILCPSGFTHTHRGNPPLSGIKYIMTTWLEYIQ